MATPRPYTLIAEITYRCPLHCAYCSNPIDLKAHGTELETEDWLRVIDEAAALGVVQIHFTGGEPLARQDLSGSFAFGTPGSTTCSSASRRPSAKHRKK